MFRLAASALNRAGYIVFRKTDSPVVVWPDGSRYPVRGFQRLHTTANVDDLYETEFDAAFRKGIARNPHSRGEAIRLRLYFAARFAEASLGAHGDLLFCGVAYGQAPRCIFDLLGPKLGNRSLIMVDPWDASRNRAKANKENQYTDDMEGVERAFHDAPAEFIRGYIPDALIDRKLCFCLLSTGDPVSEARALPGIYDMLSPGGFILIYGYGGNRRGADRLRETAHGLHGAVTINLMNGNAVIAKISK